MRGTATVLAAAQPHAVAANLTPSLAVSAAAQGIAAQGIAQVLREPKCCGWFYRGIR
jgi:hypothetical protein